MAAEIEVVYSEIVEMSTFSKTQPEIVLKPPSCSDTQFDTYICMEGSTIKPEPVPTESFENRPHCSWQTQEPERSFEKRNAIEEESVQLEKVLRSFPNFDRFPSAEDIIPRKRSSFGQESDIPPDMLSLRTRLKMKKGRLDCLSYACYAMEAVLEEVEKILFLDAVFLIFSVGVSVLGIMRVDGCTYSPTVPVVTVISGVVDAIVNMLCMITTLTKRPSLKEALRDISRMGRLTLIFIHLYGLAKVYSILPPEESDHSSPEYCDSLLFWIAFSFFHLTLLSTFVLFLGMVTAAISYNF